MADAGGYKVFLSAATSEFGTARNEIASDLAARGLTVKVQRDFRLEATTETTLQKLDLYIRQRDALVHVAGKRSGAFPGEDEAKPFLHVLPAGVTRASYAQFEFHLARHYRRTCYVYIAKDDYDPGQAKPSTDDDPALQAQHVAWLEKLDRNYFSTTHELCRLVLKQDWPNLARRRPKNLPFASLGSLFKGREEALDTLHKALTADTGAATAIVGRALHGLGGIGKTRLAVEYALQYESEHSALLFVRADTPAALETSLAALAGPDILDLPEKDAREDAAKIAAALGWCEAHPGWLMIVDNVDDAVAVAAVDRLLVRLRGGKVVVTGRAGNFPASLRKLELGVLDEAASVAFLMERTDADRAKSPDDAKLAQELAGELGGLALGLEQAGAYIATERIGFARYLTLWRDKRATVLAWFDKTLMSYDHDTGLAATWATSVDRLTPDAHRLLERLAFLAPEPVPDSLLDVAAPGDPEGFDARAARANLFAYSLVSRAAVEAGKAAQDGFAVHRLVQDFARRSMSEARRGEALREALEWVDGAFDGDPQDVRSWPVLDPLAPHAVAVAVAQRSVTAAIAAPTARLFDRFATLLQAKARYAEAEPLYRRALAIDEANYGPHHPIVAIDLNNLAGLLNATNRLREAEPLYWRALEITEASYEPNHPKIATGLNNLAGVLYSTNRFSEAELLLRRALASDEARAGPDHPIVAIRLNNLAVLLRARNRLAEAELLLQRALTIDEASGGPDHPDVARDLNNLASLLQLINRPSEAEPYYRRALTINEASYGPDHPNVALSLNNLASFLHSTSRFGDAEPLFRRALAIDEASYGPDHPDVASSLNNLAELLCATNRLSEAEPLFRRALAIDEASNGRDHPNVAASLSNLAGLLRDTDRLGDAEPLLRRALAIDEASYGQDHAEVATDLNNLAGLLRVTNRLGEAEPLLRRALAIFEASYGPDHPKTATARENLAALEAARG
jgi:tetratricopeptide (TPR) repeat protein